MVITSGIIQRAIITIMLVAIIAVPCSALISPNTETSSSTLLSRSSVHDLEYIPTWVEVMFIVIGFFTLLLSKWEPIEDIFSLISVAAFAISAWYANFMYSAVMAFQVSANGLVVQTIYNEVIVPNPVLSILMAICTIFAAINAVYIYFYKPASDKVDGVNRSASGD